MTFFTETADVKSHFKNADKVLVFIALVLLSVGFLKPHLPFNAPSKYWNLYNKQDIQLAKNRFQPKNTPQIAMHHYAELRKYLNIPNDKSIEIPKSKI